MSKFYVLQSGFVTKDTGRLAKTPESELSTLDVLLAVNVQTTDTDNYYDDGIESLFQQWRKDNALVQRFDFRESILKAAFRVFGTCPNSFPEWIGNQLVQAEVGYLHRKFLKETLAWALNCTPRSLEVYTYYRLLQANMPGSHSQVGRDNPDELLHEYISANNSANLYDILSDWTCDMNGVCDLLSTMHVIYGRRSSRLASVPPRAQI